MNRGDHYYDWVTARHECSVCQEFGRLGLDLDKFAKQRHGLLLKKSPLSFAFKGEDIRGDGEYAVQRSISSSLNGEVKFVLSTKKTTASR